MLYRGRHVTLVSFGAFAAVDGMLVVTLCCYALYLKGFAISGALLGMLPISLLMVWGGARLFHLAALGRKLLDKPSKYLAETGFYVHGGILGGVGWILLTSSVAGVPPLVLADGLFWGGALGQFFGRLGCLNYGCCFGRPTESPCGIAYTNKDSKILRWRPELAGVRVHPTQLYLAGSNLLFFLLACALLQRPIPDGALTCLCLAWHAATRLVVECFRQDIYFHGRRNPITFVASLGTLTAAAALACVGMFLIPNALSCSALVRPMTMRTVAELWHGAPALWAAVGTVGLLAFLGYGVHGRKLGMVPWVTPAESRVPAPAVVQAVELETPPQP